MSEEVKKVVVTKAEAKRTDVVTEELRKGFVWSVHHSKMVLGLLMGFIVIGGGWALVQTMSTRHEMKAQAGYYLAEKSYLAQKEKLTPKKANPKDPEDEDSAAGSVTSVKPTGDLEKDYGPSVQSFQAVMTEFPDSKAAKMSALVLSGIFADYKQSDKAIDLLKKLNSGSDLLGFLVKDRLASLMADTGDCKSATQVWENLRLNKSAGFMNGEVQLKEALCFENMHDVSRAVAIYKAIDPKTPAGKTAEKFLRSLSEDGSQPSSLKK